MKLLVSMAHPAHVHVFKNLIWKMEKRGHKIKIVARNKDVAKKLLDGYNFDYSLITDAKSGWMGLAIEMMLKVKKLLPIIKNFNPNIVLSLMDPSVAIATKIMRKRYISLADSEPANLILKTSLPFTDVVLTPSCFKKELGKKQIRYNGYHELAYLHPNYFTPNPAVLDEVGLSKDDKFTLFRFVAWKAYHDVGRRGFDLETKRKLVKELEKHATVFISSEAPLPKEFEKYRIPVPPENIHDFLYYAKLLVCDSQTMSTEAGVLGTPAIRCNSFVGENDMGNFIELEQKYGSIFNYNNPNKAINKAVELIQKPNLKEEWQNKKERLLKDKIDVTAFMIWFIENYSGSFKEIKENPEIQYRFR